MTTIISLTVAQTKQASFKHPLLDGIPSYTEEEIDALAEEVAAGKAHRDDLVMALLFCVKNTVGRFLYYCPATRGFKDDMVSVGVETLVSFEPGTGGVLKTASTAVQDTIKRHINDNIALTSASLRQQWYLVKKQQNPVYRYSVDFDSSAEIPEDYHPRDESDEEKRDILDAFSQIKPKDDIDVFLMDEYNWGRKYEELAEELGVSVSTVHRRKAKLYKKYLKIVG